MYYGGMKAKRPFQFTLGSLFGLTALAAVITFAVPAVLQLADLLSLGDRAFFAAVAAIEFLLLGAPILVGTLVWAALETMRRRREERRRRRKSCHDPQPH
jgi:hypothetical protein